MTISIDETIELAHIILECSRTPIVEIYIFGSYATGRAVLSPDLDIMVRATRKLSAVDFVSIEQELEDSDLAYIVDLVDYHSLDADVREAMLQTATNIYSRSIA